MCPNCSNKSPCRAHHKLSNNSKQLHKCLRKDNNNNRKSFSPINSFPLNNLPFLPLVQVAQQLTFNDAKNLRLTSKKFNDAEKMARASRKQLSIDVIRQLFPENSILSNRVKVREISYGYGILELQDLLRKTILSMPSGNIRELDISSLSTIKESKINEIFGTNRSRDVLKNVQRLNIENCVLEEKELMLLSQIMPKIWHLRLTERCIIINLQNNKTIRDINISQLRDSIENFDEFLRAISLTKMNSRSATNFEPKNQQNVLQIITLITQHFNNIELIELC